MKRAGRLAIFDLDGTITRHDSFLPFVAGFMVRHPGRWWRLPALLAPAMGYFAGRTSRGGLKGAILHLLMGGVPREVIEAWAAQHARRVVARGVFADALRALRAHQAAGDEIVLLSASPDLYVPRIGAALGVVEIHCTRIRWDGDRLDGRLAGENRRGEEKSRVLAALLAARPGIATIAYGNSESDLAHMLRCNEAVYVNGSARLQRATPQSTVRWVRWA